MLNVESMKKYVFLPVFLMFCSLIVVAQYNINQNNVWAFGDGGGVNFGTGSPVAFASSIFTYEGCASVADASGGLLFYTDGYDIHDRTGAIMPSGAAIVSYSASSTSQATLIVPVLGTTSRYYVFSLESLSGSGRLQYCIVDMTLNSGFGDVVSGTAATSLATGMGEHMIAVAGNNCDIWLLVHKETSTNFYAYDITVGGIGSPVISNVGTFTATDGYSIGQFKISPDRQLLGCTSYNNGSYVANGVGVELYDFSPASGVVSNVRRLDSLRPCYGIEFSPDNTKMYAVATNSPAKLEQWDVTGSTAAAIRASITTIRSVSGSVYPSLRLASNNKIYLGSMTGTTSGFLDCIATPNTSGSGCGFTSHAVTLTSGTGVYYGLPNIYVAGGSGDTVFKHYDTVVCMPTGRTVTFTADTSGTGYLWNDGTTSPSHTFGSFGTYWVYISNGCQINIDTFHLRQQPFDTTGYRKDTSVCQLLAPITLSGRAGYATYRWYDGSFASTHAATTAGVYWVAVSDTCGNVLVDTMHVDFVAPDTTVGNTIDTSLCISIGTITRTARAGFTSYRWNTGSTASSINVTTSGTYWVYCMVNCSVIVDTFHVTFIQLPLVNIGNDTAFCVGKTITLTSTQPSGYNMLWSDGTTGSSMDVSSSGTYWLQVYNGCTVTDSIHVLVSPYPVVDLGPDLFNCDGLPVTLSSSVVYSSPSFWWSDGTTASSTTAASTGYYWLKVSVAGCISADTIHVTIQWDTFTLFNRDTAICRGKSVQALATTNPDVTYQWLPTAGIAVSNVSCPYITPDTSAMYIMYVHMAGCPDRMDSFFIEVQPNPDVFIGGNRFICQFDTIHIHASVHPAWFYGYTYSWSPGTYLDNTNTANVVYTAGSTQKYILTVTTSAGCVGQDSANLIANPGNFAIASPDVSLCPHDSAQLTITGASGGSFRWYPSLYLSDSASATPWVHPISSTNYAVVATSAAGCRDTAHIQVTVYPNAIIFLGDSVTIYPGESFQFSPFTNCSNFSWFPPTGLSNPNISNPVATPTIDSRYIVYGITTNGCKASDSISVHVSAESVLALPNAFTPGNGVNNHFSIIKRGEANLNYFRVYNRWGNLVFETKNIEEGWDGSYKGKPQPEDVYVYDIQAVTSTGVLFSKHGNVTLLK